MRLPRSLVQSRRMEENDEPSRVKKGDFFQVPTCLWSFVRLAPFQEVIAELRLSLRPTRLAKLRSTAGQSVLWWIRTLSAGLAQVRNKRRAMFMPWLNAR